jgi:predicted lipoprotein with Yx(FWY)xxD motif
MEANFMKFPKHAFLFPIVLSLAIIVAACGNATSSTGSGPYSSSKTTGGSTPAATTNPGSANVVIQTASVTLKGKSATALANSKGWTLYYLSADTATQSMCSGGCAQTWPPLLQSGSGLPTGPGSLPGKLTVVTTANGSQVEYNGHLLYTYSGDTGPSQTNGEGIGGVWHVVTSDLQPQGGGTSNPYGY